MTTKKLIYGVGFIGSGENKSSVYGALNSDYICWFSMLRRCYSPIELKRKPTYSGVTVCKDWHDFQNFSNWYKDNHIKGFEIDKDTKQKGVKNKIYSPSTCCFISRKDNVSEARAKNYKFIDPKGNIVDVYNLSKFCRNNNLNRSHMNSVNVGERVHHKLWTKAKINKPLLTPETNS